MATSVSLLLAILASVRFPEVPLLAILPAVIGVALASVLPPRAGVWAAGILPAALIARLPQGLPLACVVALAPALAGLARTRIPVRPLLIATAAIPATAYLAAAAGSGSFTVPLHHVLDLCAAIAIGATLAVIAYAPTQGERLGAGGRAGFRLR